MPANLDPIYSDERLAELYDHFDGDRDDLDEYERIISELGATNIADLGCGTGTLALRLAVQGHDVVGVDPAGASVEVARGKPSARNVRWVDLPLVTFVASFVFPDGVVTSTSVLRFRSKDEITEDLHRAGFHIREIRDAPDRPGREWIFVAERLHPTMAS